MNGATVRRWDTAFSMNDRDEKPEPAATPWPTHIRKKGAVAWPPELDEDTWPRGQRDEADEE